MYIYGEYRDCVLILIVSSVFKKMFSDSKFKKESKWNIKHTLQVCNLQNCYFATIGFRP